jgi:hypothetical protein
MISIRIHISVIGIYFMNLYKMYENISLSIEKFILRDEKSYKNFFIGIVLKYVHRICLV